MKVVIMRGCQGAGKDYWLRKNHPDAFIVSTDEEMYIDGTYVYQPDRLSEFHNRTLRQYVNALTLGKPLIAVSNMNPKAIDIAPYYRLAEAFGYDVEIVWVIAPPEVCAERNVHNVPFSQVNKIFAGMEALPPWWKVKVVFN